MCCFTAIVKRVIPFVAAFAVGTIGVSLVALTAFESRSMTLEPVTSNPASEISRKTSGTGMAICSGVVPGSDEAAGFLDFKKDRSKTESFKITSKPKATYTEDARTNNVEGTVRLKVTLLASGQIGSIRPVTELPFGLTQQAVAAARKIKFEPKRVNGVLQSVIVTIEYNFDLY